MLLPLSALPPERLVHLPCKRCDGSPIAPVVFIEDRARVQAEQLIEGANLLGPVPRFFSLRPRNLLQDVFGSFPTPSTSISAVLGRTRPLLREWLPRRSPGEVSSPRLLLQRRDGTPHR